METNAVFNTGQEHLAALRVSYDNRGRRRITRQVANKQSQDNGAIPVIQKTSVIDSSVQSSFANLPQRSIHHQKKQKRLKRLVEVVDEEEENKEENVSQVKEDNTNSDDTLNNNNNSITCTNINPSSSGSVHLSSLKSIFKCPSKSPINSQKKLLFTTNSLSFKTLVQNTAINKGQQAQRYSIQQANAVWIESILLNANNIKGKIDQSKVRWHTDTTLVYEYIPYSSSNSSDTELDDDMEYPSMDIKARTSSNSEMRIVPRFVISTPQPTQNMIDNSTASQTLTWINLVDKVDSTPIIPAIKLVNSRTSKISVRVSHSTGIVSGLVMLLEYTHQSDSKWKSINNTFIHLYQMMSPICVHTSERSDTTVTHLKSVMPSILDASQATVEAQLSDKYIKVVQSPTSSVDVDKTEDGVIASDITINTLQRESCVNKSLLGPQRRDSAFSSLRRTFGSLSLRHKRTSNAKPQMLCDDTTPILDSDTSITADSTIQQSHTKHTHDQLVITTLPIINVISSSTTSSLAIRLFSSSKRSTTPDKRSTSARVNSSATVGKVWHKVRLYFR